MSAEKNPLPRDSYSVSNLTPKRKSITKISLTPMCSIKEESQMENPIKRTPVTVNPFDVKAESLYFPSCSPFLATLSRNKKKDGKFRWSIEQLSFLYPADIDESSLPPEIGVDSEQEVEAQKAIDAFFSQNSIVPSPWSDSPSSSSKNGIKLRRASHMVYNVKNVNSCDTATQTTLTVPPKLDLEALLGKYFTYNDQNESFFSHDNSREETDSLSTSSLRRKLFVNEEECASPSKIENKNLFNAKLWSTPTSKRLSVHSTPSDVLSSSPITPPNCSDSCNILSSPPVSPITADRRSSSVHMRSFDVQNDVTDSNDIYYSPEAIPPDAYKQEMSFLDSQLTNPFPSYRSEKQDTGYMTGSTCSFQNMNYSEVNCGVVSRISPVMELMEECELSKSVCNMSYTNDYQPVETSSVLESKHQPMMTSCHLKSYPWEPTCSSTPAPNLKDT